MSRRTLGRRDDVRLRSHRRGADGVDGWGPARTPGHHPVGSGQPLPRGGRQREKGRRRSRRLVPAPCGVDVGAHDRRVPRQPVRRRHDVGLVDAGRKSVEQRMPEKRVAIGVVRKTAVESRRRLSRRRRRREWMVRTADREGSAGAADGSPARRLVHGEVRGEALRTGDVAALLRRRRNGDGTVPAVDLPGVRVPPAVNVGRMVRPLEAVDPAQQLVKPSFAVVDLRLQSDELQRRRFSRLVLVIVFVDRVVVVRIRRQRRRPTPRRPTRKRRVRSRNRDSASAAANIHLVEDFRRTRHGAARSDWKRKRLAGGDRFCRIRRRGAGSGDRRGWSAGETVRHARGRRGSVRPAQRGGEQRAVERRVGGREHRIGNAPGGGRRHRRRQGGAPRRQPRRRRGYGGRHRRRHRLVRRHRPRPHRRRRLRHRRGRRNVDRRRRRLNDIRACVDGGRLRRLTRYRTERRLGPTR